jgi:RNA polymerase sigma-70 factor (ECF subfamily)
MAALHVDAASDEDGIEEALLVERLTAYEADAWRLAFERYFPPIYRLAVRRTIQISTAEDVAADVFAEAAKGIGRYRYRGIPFRAWLFRIANNVIADHLKARRKWSGGRQVEMLEETAAAIGADLDLQTDFNRALEYLTPEQKTVVLLRLVEGCSLLETATALGKSTGAVKQLQRRALAVLRERMSFQEGTGI